MAREVMGGRLIAGDDFADEAEAAAARWLSREEPADASVQIPPRPALPRERLGEAPGRREPRRVARSVRRAQLDDEVAMETRQGLRRAVAVRDPAGAGG